jgi:hypothetical protein
MITNGLFTNVKINVYPDTTPDIIWTFAHAAQFLPTAFTVANPNMDDPVKFVLPSNTTPAKK